MLLSRLRRLHCCTLTHLTLVLKVADDYIGLDVLSSQSDVRVANFRKLLALPIYGMAQASRDVSAYCLPL